MKYNEHFISYNIHDGAASSGFEITPHALHSLHTAYKYKYKYLYAAEHSPMQPLCYEIRCQKINLSFFPNKRP
jgi:hypothetical protein